MNKKLLLMLFNELTTSNEHLWTKSLAKLIQLYQSIQKKIFEFFSEWIKSTKRSAHIIILLFWMGHECDAMVMNGLNDWPVQHKAPSGEINFCTYRETVMRNEGGHSEQHAQLCTFFLLYLSVNFNVTYRSGYLSTYGLLSRFWF